MSDSKLPTADVRLQILLRAEHRNPAGAKRALAAARQLGLSTTGVGAASFSARVPQSQWTKLFAGDLDPSASSKSVALSQAPLKVPKELSTFVESITVAPQHQKY